MSLATFRKRSASVVILLVSAAVFALPGAALAEDPHADGGGPPPADASGVLLEDIADGSVDTTSVDEVAAAIDSPTFDQYQGNSPVVTDGGGSSDLPKGSDTPLPSVPTCPSSGDTSGGGDSVMPTGDSDSVKLVGDPSDTSGSGDTSGSSDSGSTPPPSADPGAHGGGAPAHDSDAPTHDGDAPAPGGDAPIDNCAVGGGDVPDEPAEGGGGPDAPPAVGGGNGGPDNHAPDNHAPDNLAPANPVASGGGAGGLPFTGLGLASLFGIGSALLAFGVSMHIRARRRRAAGVTTQGFDGFDNRMA